MSATRNGLRASLAALAELIEGTNSAMRELAKTAKKPAKKTDEKPSFLDALHDELVALQAAIKSSDVEDSVKKTDALRKNIINYRIDNENVTSAIKNMALKLQVDDILNKSDSMAQSLAEAAQATTSATANPAAPKRTLKRTVRQLQLNIFAEKTATEQKDQAQPNSPPVVTPSKLKEWRPLDPVDPATNPQFDPLEKEYLAFDPKNNIGICRLRGERRTQEDADTTGTMSEAVGQLDNQTLKDMLKKTGDTLEKRIEQELGDVAVMQGSCFLANVIVGSTVYTANIGDSTAFAVVLDARGQVASFDQLNPVLHNEGVVDPIIARLAVNRSLGDTHFNDFGLKHDADVTEHAMQIPKKGRAFVITACDGLTEKNPRTGIPCLTTKEIGTIVANLKDKPVNEIAETLARTALAKGSKDNVSVIVTEVDPTSNKPKYAVVADGHGGSKVSQFVEKNVASVMNTELTNALRLTSSAPRLQ